MKNGKLKAETYRKSAEYTQIANQGTARVIKFNDKKGIPSVLSINGKIYYRMPGGKLTTKSPFKKSLKKNEK